MGMDKDFSYMILFGPLSGEKIDPRFPIPITLKTPESEEYYVSVKALDSVKETLKILSKALLIGSKSHYECEDNFYGCPESEGYFGTGTGCTCGLEERQAAIARVKARGDWPLD